MCRTGGRRCPGSGGHGKSGGSSASSAGGHASGPQVSDDGSAIAFGPGSQAFSGDLTEFYDSAPAGAADYAAAARARAATMRADAARARAGASTQAEPGTQGAETFGGGASSGPGETVFGGRRNVYR